jgi:hypothetical protein
MSAEGREGLRRCIRNVTPFSFHTEQNVRVRARDGSHAPVEEDGLRVTEDVCRRLPPHVQRALGAHAEQHHAGQLEHAVTQLIRGVRRVIIRV